MKEKTVNCWGPGLIRVVSRDNYSYKTRIIKIYFGKGGDG